MFDPAAILERSQSDYRIEKRDKPLDAILGRLALPTLVTERADWARSRGLSLVGLYAVASTSSPVTAKQGFAKYGALTYWERPREHAEEVAL